MKPIEILKEVKAKYDEWRRCSEKGLIDPNGYFDDLTIKLLEGVNLNVSKILDRHKNWKPTEGHGSEEELGYQKGLIAEAKLLKREISELLESQLSEIKKI